MSNSIFKSKDFFNKQIFSIVVKRKNDTHISFISFVHLRFLLLWPPFVYGASQKIGLVSISFVGVQRFILVVEIHVENAEMRGTWQNEAEPVHDIF